MASGVARRIDQENLGFRRDGGRQLSRGDFEAVGFFAANDAGDAACELYLLGVGHPIRGWQNDFVAGVEQGHEGHVEAMFAPARW